MVTLAAGAALGGGAAVANGVPLLLGEVGEPRADRSGWSQAAEFVSLVLDSGWAWAATAVVVGWLVSDSRRPGAAVRIGAVAGCAALVVATAVYYGGELLFNGGAGWGEVRYWWIRSLVLGLPLGAVGATIRRPGPAGMVAALVVPVGAALNMVLLPPPADSPVAEPVLLTVWGGAAAATVIAVRVLRARRGRTDSAAYPIAPS